MQGNRGIRLKEYMVGIVIAVVGWIGGVLSFAWKVSAKLSRLEVLAENGEKDRQYLRGRIDELYSHFFKVQ